jgi:Leucine-rich repeat (LRR) protein
MTPAEADVEAIRLINAAIEAGASSLSLWNLPLIHLPPAIERLSETLRELEIGNVRPVVENNRLAWKFDWDEKELRPQASLDVDSLSRLSSLRNLELLNMAGVRGLQDLLWISPFVLLKALHLTGRFTDLIPLENFPHLRVLNIGGVETHDISPLRDLYELQVLHISGDGLCELDSIAKLTKLEFLHVDGGKIHDYRPLANLGRLKTLSLRSDSQRDLGPLANLRQLETLTVCDGMIEDLTPLANLPALRRIFFEWGGTSDIRPLISIPHLEEISLYDCYSVTEIPPELASRITCRTGV